ncbi:MULTISPECIES: copper resistance system multicopper oxidase [unclassified Luteibacter]|uniref:copper resistance system multicopper oxidase n=1 Tax=unclassified Luteibacter TaxID=2620188 RepID=UPI0005B91424|nr:MULTISPECIES: copper resistance system multicopper oxidase [unclassified Luteibacter]MDR6644253.1 FtsP/CotA-like multicopper oxidase with cupredoxin domain [Luteibacter sp. 1214]
MRRSDVPSILLPRRRFVQGLTTAGVGLGLGLIRPAWATEPMSPASLLAGNAMDLEIREASVDFTGRARRAVTVNGGVPGPTLRWKEGETVSLHVKNHLDTTSSIHWHGLIVPADQDGVPGISFDGVPAGSSFTYRFPVRQSGTYWYHAHSRFQEQSGLYGAIVIEPKEGERHVADRDYVLLISDWTDEDPERVYAKLRTRSDVYNYGQPTLSDFLRDARAKGLGEAASMRSMWNRMRMNMSDLADVSGATYTYLVNGATPAANWTGLFRPGERVRLRLINGSSNSIFDLRIPGLRLRVIAADGQDVEPVLVDELRLSAAETYDVIVEPGDDRAYTIFAQSIDRSGYARATLAPREGMAAPLPPLDPRPRLAMRDMMGSMADDAADDSGMVMARHARSEYGAGVDMRVDMPRTNLDDPGVGLRDRAHRVLTYADLHTLGGALDTREPSRTIELHLTGNMERFMWSFDGLKYSEAKPVHFRSGERLRVTLVNDTMMNHPIHLHGMWSEIESPDGAFQVRKHTVNIQPAQQVSYAVTADNPGRWAFHCHMLYHMEAGMFREVVVS